MQKKQTITLAITFMEGVTDDQISGIFAAAGLDEWPASLLDDGRTWTVPVALEDYVGAVRDLQTRFIVLSVQVY